MVYLVANVKLYTKYRLIKRRVNVDPICHLRKGTDETLDHLTLQVSHRCRYLV